MQRLITFTRRTRSIDFELQIKIRKALFFSVRLHCSVEGGFRSHEIPLIVPTNVFTRTHYAHRSSCLCVRISAWSQMQLSVGSCETGKRFNFDIEWMDTGIVHCMQMFTDEEQNNARPLNFVIVCSGSQIRTRAIQWKMLLPLIWVWSLPHGCLSSAIFLPVSGHAHVAKTPVHWKAFTHDQLVSRRV